MGAKAFLKQFVSLGFGSFIYLLVGLIGTPIITRLVDPGVYGDFSIFIVYSNIGLMVFGLGLDQSLIRFFYSDSSIAYRQSLLQECIIPSVIFAGFTGLVMLAGAFCINKLGNAYFSLAYILLIFINVLTLIFNRYSTLVTRLNYHSNTYSAINVTQKTLYIAFAVFCVLSGHQNHFLVLAFSTIISTIFASMIGFFSERDLWMGKVHHLDKTKIERNALIKYGIPLMFSSSITMLFNALDKLALDWFCTRSDVGVYTSAINLLAAFSVIRLSFNALWMPAAVEHYEKNKEDKSFFQNGNTFVTIMMMVMGAGMVMCKDLFVLLLGEKYHAAAAIFPFLMFEPIMYTISETTVTGLVVEKKSSFQVVVAAVSCFTNFIGNLILTPMLGPTGAAISTGFSYIVFFAMRTFLSNRVFYVDYHLLKLAVVTILLIIYSIYGSMNHFALIHLIGFIVFCFVIVVLYHNDLKMGIELLRGMIKRKVSQN